MSRNPLRWTVLALAAAGLLASAPASAQTSITNDGGDAYSYHPAGRSIVENGYGIWALHYDVTAGRSYITYSADGLTWNGSRSLVFPTDVNSASDGNYPAMFYVAKTSAVYVVISDTTPVTVGLAATIYIASATLTTSGLPTFNPPASRVMTKSIGGNNAACNCVRNNAAAATVTGIGARAQLSLTAMLSTTGSPLKLYVAMHAHSTLAREGYLIAEIDPDTLTSSVIGGQYAANAAFGLWPVVTQMDAVGQGRFAVLYKDGTNGAWNVDYWDATTFPTPNNPYLCPNIARSVVIAANAVDIDASSNYVATGTASGAYYVGASTGYFAINARKSINYFYTSYNKGAGTNAVIATSSSPYGNPSIGLYGGTTAYIVVVGTAANDANYLVVNYLRGTTLPAAVWTLNITPAASGLAWNGAGNNSLGNSQQIWPSVTNVSYPPTPPRVLFSSYSTTLGTFDAYFGTIYTNSAPTLTGFSPSTAPSNSNTVTVDVVGTNFGDDNGADYGVGVKVLVGYNTGAGATAINPQSPSAVTAVVNTVTKTKLTATITVGSNFGGGAGFNISNSTLSPHFDIRVQNPDGQLTSVDIGTFTVYAPTMTSVYIDSPAHYLTSSTFDYVINGSSMAAWPAISTLTVAITGNPGISLSPVTYVSPNQIRATLIMGNTLGGLNPNYNLRLTNPDGQMSNLLTSTFTVFSPSTGTAYAVDYKEVLRSSTFSVVLNGSYFQNWTSTQTSIYLSSSPLLTAVAAPATGYFLYPTNEISTAAAYGLTVTPSATPGLSQIVVPIAVSTFAINGNTSYYFLLSNPDGLESAVSIATFSVPAPAIVNTYEDAPKHYLTAQTYDYVIRGVNMQKWTNAAWTGVAPATWTTVQFLEGGVPSPDVLINSGDYSAFASSQQVVLNITVTPSPTFSGGPYDIKIINPDGQSIPASVAVATFTIPAPSTGTAYMIDPTEVLRGSTFTLRITGSNFQDWTSTRTAIYLSSAPQLTASGFFRYPTTEISTAVGYGFTIAPSAVPGQSSIDVVVQVSSYALNGAASYYFLLGNPDGQRTTPISVATVAVAVPSLYGLYVPGAAVASGGIAPLIAEGTLRPTRALVVQGANFQNWSVRTASVAVSGGGVAVDSITWISNDSFQANLRISTNAANGLRNVTVFNPDGQFSSVLTSTFIVTVPTVTIISPVPAIGPSLSVSSFVLVAGVQYSTGFASMRGTAGFLPAGAQTSLLTTQIRITRMSDNFVWSGGAFANPNTGFSPPQSENHWRDADGGGTASWSYAWGGQPGARQQLFDHRPRPHRGHGLVDARLFDHRHDRQSAARNHQRDRAAGRGGAQCLGGDQHRLEFRRHAQPAQERRGLRLRHQRYRRHGR